MRRFDALHMTLPEEYEENAGCVFINPFDLPEKKIFRIDTPFHNFLVEGENENNAAYWFHTWMDFCHYKKMDGFDLLKKQIPDILKYPMVETELPKIRVVVREFTIYPNEQGSEEGFEDYCSYRELGQWHYACFNEVRSGKHPYLRSDTVVVGENRKFYYMYFFFPNEKLVCDLEFLTWILSII